MCTVVWAHTKIQMDKSFVKIVLLVNFKTNAEGVRANLAQLACTKTNHLIRVEALVRVGTAPILVIRAMGIHAAPPTITIAPTGRVGIMTQNSVRLVLALRLKQVLLRGVQGGLLVPVASTRQIHPVPRSTEPAGPGRRAAVTNTKQIHPVPRSTEPAGPGRRVAVASTKQTHPVPRSTEFAGPGRRAALASMNEHHPLLLPTEIVCLVFLVDTKTKKTKMPVNRVAKVTSFQATRLLVLSVRMALTRTKPIKYFAKRTAGTGITLRVTNPPARFVLLVNTATNTMCRLVFPTVPKDISLSMTGQVVTRVLWGLTMMLRTQHFAKLIAVLAITYQLIELPAFNVKVVNTPINPIKCNALCVRPTWFQLQVLLHAARPPRRPPPRRPPRPPRPRNCQQQRRRNDHPQTEHQTAETMLPMMMETMPSTTKEMLEPTLAIPLKTRMVLRPMLQILLQTNPRVLPTIIQWR